MHFRAEVVTISGEANRFCQARVSLSKQKWALSLV
jgi:hypothetical protein